MTELPPELALQRAQRWPKPQQMRTCRVAEFDWSSRFPRWSTPTSAAFLHIGALCIANVDGRVNPFNEWVRE